MEYFLKHKITIMRFLGVILLVVGFAVHFWTTPKEGLSQNDKAAARVARMEANTKGSSTKSSKTTQKDNSKFLEKLKNTQYKVNKQRVSKTRKKKK